jgi:hypothetical protein
LELVLRQEVRSVICRDVLQVKMPWLWRLVMLVQLVLMSPFFFMASIFTSRKSSLALVLLQWTENNLVGQLIKGQGVDRLYLFGGYENDQCLTGLFLEEARVKLTLVPSPNPIKNFYRQVIADEFVFTSPFQRKEWQDIRHNWKVLKTLDWPLPEVKKLLPYIKVKEAPRNQIAFMSRGIWLRKLRGLHAQNGNADFEYEENCMSALKVFLLRHPAYELLVLPHPIERKNQSFWEQTQSFYQSYFNGVKVNFPNNPELPSYQLFDQSFLSVASISSVNLERLFCGYMTLFAPIGAQHYFFSNSELDNVVARTESDFLALLEKCVSMDEESFFREFKLEEYRYQQG